MVPDEKKLFINKKNGLLYGENTLYLPSPHHNDRPNNIAISLLVIHGISLPPGIFGKTFIDDLFLGKLDPNANFYFKKIFRLQVSTHLLINRHGLITQYVPFNKRAWHAGDSSFKNKKNCNDFSVGIELEGTDKIPYTKKQYLMLAKVTKLLQRCYPEISSDNIVGHQHIAPGRKTDPGPSFNWQYYRKLLNSDVE